MIESQREIEDVKLRIESAKLQVETERLELEKKKAEAERKFLNKNIGTIITAIVSLAAVFVSYAQIRVTSISKDKELQVLEKQKDKELILLQLQKEKEMEMTLIERERDWNLNITKFVTEHSKVIFSKDQEQRMAIRRVMFITFPKNITEVMFERIEQASPPEAKKEWHDARAILALPETNKSSLRQIDFSDYFNKRASTPLVALEEDRDISSSVYIEGAIQFADDDAIVLINGKKVMAWQVESSRVKKIYLKNGVNSLEIQVFNRQTYGCGVIIRCPEGWRYAVKFRARDGKDLYLFEDGEDRPEDRGPHHGKLFTVARGNINVDSTTGAVTFTAIDKDIWKSKNK